MATLNVRLSFSHFLYLMTSGRKRLTRNGKLIILLKIIKSDFAEENIIAGKQVTIHATVADIYNSVKLIVACLYG